jgi:DNA-binding NtrC family response regulator
MIGRPHILVVDDETVVRESLQEWFREDGYEVGVAASGAEALELLDTSDWDVVLADIKMPGINGLDLQNRIAENWPETAVIITTAYASVATAVQALKAGAYDYIVKPIDPEDLGRLVAKAAERRELVVENRRLKQQIESIAESGASEIIGESSPLQRTKELIHEVAQTDATVLVIGESGTGKELVARAIHRASERRHMPLVVANCAGLPNGLVESELFGHEKGAYTGAQFRRKGKFELADGGAIFFDEIGDINAKTQVDLLRVLEDKTFTRLGGNRPINVNFRIIAATNKDLNAEVQEGRFRLDLYYRVNVFSIEIPALRDRKEDILLLAHYFLAKSSRSMGRPTGTISKDTMRHLQAYHWPGNVRELENAIERAVVVRSDDTVRPTDLPAALHANSPAAGLMTLDAVEQRHIQFVLDTMDGNVSRAARALSIDRATLYNKIKKYQLER